MKETVPIRISKKLYDYLNKVGVKGESYSDIIERLINKKDNTRK